MPGPLGPARATSGVAVDSRRLEGRIDRTPSRSASAATASGVTSATSAGRVSSTTRTRSPPGGSGTSSTTVPANTFWALPSGGVRESMISRGLTVRYTVPGPAALLDRHRPFRRADRRLPMHSPIVPARPTNRLVPTSSATNGERGYRSSSSRDARLGHAALVEHHDPVAEHQRLDRAVGDVERHARQPLQQAAQLDPHRAAGLDVERRQRLVEQQHARARAPARGRARRAAAARPTARRGIRPASSGMPTRPSASVHRGADRGARPCRRRGGRTRRSRRPRGGETARSPAPRIRCPAARPARGGRSPRRRTRTPSSVTWPPSSRSSPASSRSTVVLPAPLSPTRPWCCRPAPRRRRPARTRPRRLTRRASSTGGERRRGARGRAGSQSRTARETSSSRTDSATAASRSLWSAR